MKKVDINLKFQFLVAQTQANNFSRTDLKDIAMFWNLDYLVRVRRTKKSFKFFL